MSSLNNRHLLVQDWERWKYRRYQRLGRYMAAARARSGETIRPIVLAARDLGQPLSSSTISEMEALREYDPADANEPPRSVGFFAVLFLTRYYGGSLADLERYLLSGEDGDPTVEQRAEVVKRAFVALPEADRAEVESFLAYRQQQASARTFDPDAEMPAPRRASHPSHRSAPSQPTPTPTPQGDPTTAPRR